jgi:hypothetical protein
MRLVVISSILSGNGVFSDILLVMPRRDPARDLAEVFTFVATRPSGGAGAPILGLYALPIWAVAMVVVNVTLFRFLFCNRVIGRHLCHGKPPIRVARRVP